MKAQESIQTTKLNKHVYVKARSTGHSFFLQTVRANIRALWTEEWDLSDFINSMRNTIHTFYYRAWFEGAAECGIMPDEISNQESFWLRSRILTDQLYSDKLGLDVDENNKRHGGKLYSFYARADLWANNYNEVRNMAQLMSCHDQKEEWVITAKESCPSCKKMAGIVKRASFWREHDVYPQHRGKLECMIDAGGVPVCKCYFKKTDKRVTPGSLPLLP